MFSRLIWKQLYVENANRIAKHTVRTNWCTLLDHILPISYGLCWSPELDSVPVESGWKTVSDVGKPYLTLDGKRKKKSSAVVHRVVVETKNYAKSCAENARFSMKSLGRIVPPQNPLPWRHQSAGSPVNATKKTRKFTRHKANSWEKRKGIGR
jgi:hypothetical protein